MHLSESERAILDDCVARRSDEFAKPPWMPAMRATMIRLEARRLIGDLPAPETRPTRQRTYDAPRRVVAVNEHGGDRGQTHEAGADGLRDCHLRKYFLDRSENLIEQLGPGPVTCGHCANLALDA